MEAAFDNERRFLDLGKESLNATWHSGTNEEEAARQADDVIKKFLLILVSET